MKRLKKSLSEINLFSTITSLAVIFFVVYIFIYFIVPPPLSGPQTPPLNLSGTIDPSSPKPEYVALLKNKNLLSNINNKLALEEISNRLKDLLNLQSEDTDNDELSDLSEILIYGTNPLFFDSNLNDVSDATELHGGLNPLTALAFTNKERRLIDYRIQYWGTDFALSKERTDVSSRDLLRIADAGEIVVLMSSYYRKYGHYPVASSWKGAWREIVDKNPLGILVTGSLRASTKVFRGSDDGEVPLDPINSNPFIYGYHSLSGGTGYEYTYALEGRMVARAQIVKKGILGEVTEEAIKP